MESGWNILRCLDDSAGYTKDTWNWLYTSTTRNSNCWHISWRQICASYLRIKIRSSPLNSSIFFHIYRLSFPLFYRKGIGSQIIRSIIVSSTLISFQYSQLYPSTCEGYLTVMPKLFSRHYLPGVLKFSDFITDDYNVYCSNISVECASYWTIIVE